MSQRPGLRCLQKKDGSIMEDDNIVGASVALTVEQLTVIKLALALHLVKVDGSKVADAATAWISELKLPHAALLDIMDSTYALLSDVLEEIEVTSVLPELFAEVRRILIDNSK